MNGYRPEYAAHRFELFSIKRIKRELERTIESRDTLYSVIAHDLRSPLGSLQMMNNAILMMVDKDKVGDEVFEMLKMMNKTSEEIFLLLDNLLKWAKSRLNKQIVFKQVTDVNSIVDSTAQIYIPVAEQKGITLEILNIDKELNGFVDIDMLKTIIRNLVSNALKFTYSGGKVVVETKESENGIVVSVSDSGKGMTGEEIDKLINKNINFTTYGTNNEKGSGLGLMLCKDFIKLHNGELSIDSKPGEGSTFRFTLPSGN